MKRICVFAGSSVGSRPDYGAAAAALGAGLAARGIVLVYGGGGTGLMGVLADAVLGGGGEVIGVIPGALADRELAHDGVTSLEIVDSMHARKARMAELASGFIALPGGLGTLEEFMEAWTWAQLGIHRKPCGLMNVDGFYDPLLEFVGAMVREGFVDSKYMDIVMAESDALRLLDRLESYEPPRVRQWLDESET